jgi:hypothetical protein
MEDERAIDDKEFWALNFERRDYTDGRGKTQSELVMTEDGFAALALAFTGAKAANLRVAFVKAFRKATNQLKKAERQKLDPNWLLERQRTKDHMGVLNDILVASRARDGKQTLPHHFVNEAKLIAHAMTGSSTAELDRSAMSAPELKILDKVVRACAGYIVAGDLYEVRKAKARGLAMTLLDAMPPSLQALNGITKLEVAA